MESKSMNVRWTTLLIVVACISFVNEGYAFDFSGVRTPAGTETFWVGENIQHNGVAMDVKLLKSRRTVDEMMNFYRDMWGADGAQGEGYVEQTVGDYQIISRIEGNHNIVVQLKRDGDGYTEGYLSAIDISTLNNASDKDDFPSLPNTTLVSKTVSNDSGKEGITRVLMNGHSVSSNVEFYRSRLESSGWKQAHSRAEGDTVITFYNRSNMSMEIAISKRSGKDTVIFVNVVEES